MFSVIYRFKVIPAKTKEFVQGWQGLTKLIYQYEGSLGSTLTRDKSGDYIAYANWPSQAIWENAGNNLPDSADGYRKLMKESCVSIETLFELNEIENLWKTEIHNP